VLALIESREMAEAAAEYQAAQRSAELARTTHNREKSLWEKKVTAEQDYLTAKNTWQEAQIRLDLAKQKMQTLGGSGENGKPSRYHELKSPLAGLVIERELTLGEFVDTSHKAFTVADLSVLWVETAIAPDDLPRVKEGQAAIVEGNGKQGEGKLIFVSPVINPDTRSAKAIIELKNQEGQWRSGDYANASIITDTQSAGMIIPQEAVQSIEGKPVVFVKTSEGFEKREITAGKKDGKNIEVASGLTAGEEVAIGNTFVLKAEAGKSEAEHSH
jgi:membrane fusion protein, heavy metal efflux system